MAYAGRQQSLSPTHAGEDIPVSASPHRTHPWLSTSVRLAVLGFTGRAPCTTRFFSECEGCLGLLSLSGPARVVP